MGKWHSVFDVLQDPRARDLPPGAKLLAVYLEWRQGSNGETWPGVDTIAADLHLDERHCRRLLAEMEAAGCFEKISGRCGRGHSNRYVMLLGKSGQITPILDGAKGGNSPAFPQEKRGQKCQKKGANNPLNKKEVTNKSIGRTRKPPVFTPPGVDEVRAYASTRGDPQFDAEHFVEYYRDRDWKHKGNKPMKDWQQTVRDWIRRDNQRRIERGEPPHDGYAQYGCHPATEEDIERLEKLGVFAK